MVVQAGVEECDDGNMVDTDACLPTCKTAKCGDGKVQAGVEECDDGNMVDTDACRTTCKAAKCGDGVVQAGVEECDDGNMVDNDACTNACKSGIKKTYSQQFTGGQNVVNQCTAWNTFRGSLAAAGYTKLTMRGNLDMVGKVCTGVNANTLCQALKNNTTITLACDGNTWRTGQCGGGIEITTSSAICQCDSPAHTVRPCIGNTNWGGMAGATCGAGTQTLEVICE
jgi:cysteine-rich repeat protein